MQETRLAQVIAERLSPYSIAEQLAALTTGYTPDLQLEQEETTYYDRPVLKAPLWRWEIIWYFFFGGLAAGCYIIATIASFFGSREDRAVVRAGYYTSLLTDVDGNVGAAWFRADQRHYSDHSSGQRWTAGAMVGSAAAGSTAAKIDRAARNRSGHVPGWLYRGAAGSHQYSPVVAQQAAGGGIYLFCDVYQLGAAIFAPAPQQCTYANTTQAGAS